MSYKPEAVRAARRYFRNPRDRRIFVRQMGAEAGFQDLTSPAGAQGPAQIMPATARGWGVKNVHDPREAYGAAARAMAGYLRSYKGDWAKALAAYNAGAGAVAKYGGVPPFAETQGYVKKILGGLNVKAGKLGGGGASLTGARGKYAAGHGAMIVPGKTTIDETGALVDALLQNEGKGGLLKRYQALIDTGNYTSTSAPRVKGAKLAKFTPGEDLTVDAGAKAFGRRKGGVKITGPNPGRIQPEVRAFMSELSGVFGKTIVGSDGTGHSKYTTTGNVSEHYTGNASDIPASGATLTKMGQDALIAAGMSPARARKIRGGLFNLTWKGRRVQIIFNTNVGGNHWDHLHVGVH